MLVRILWEPGLYQPRDDGVRRVRRRMQTRPGTSSHLPVGALTTSSYPYVCVKLCVILPEIKAAKSAETSTQNAAERRPGAGLPGLPSWAPIPAIESQPKNGAKDFKRLSFAY